MSFSHENDIIEPGTVNPSKFVAKMRFGILFIVELAHGAREIGGTYGFCRYRAKKSNEFR
jgi:hypothetical protein